MWEYCELLYNENRKGKDGAKIGCFHSKNIYENSLIEAILTHTNMRTITEKITYAFDGLVFWMDRDEYKNGKMIRRSNTHIFWVRGDRIEKVDWYDNWYIKYK